MRARTTVHLIGCGPGDPELLTVKAARLIAQADAALFDKLVAPEVLALLPEGCERIDVGKEHGQKCRSQQEINQLLVEAARRHRRVVRLKGGDPFVFGRGGEEALHLRAHNVDFEVVPGISSSVAAPAYAGIPVTHRAVACSYAVVTGHEAPDKARSQVDWRGLRSVGTVVVLMGVSRRQEIASELLSGGRPADEPVAFVEHGTTRRQHVVRSTLGEVASRPPPVESPAVMVVGEVVNLSDALHWFTPPAEAAAARAEPRRRGALECTPPAP